MATVGQGTQRPSKSAQNGPQRARRSCRRPANRWPSGGLGTTKKERKTKAPAPTPPTLSNLQEQRFPTVLAPVIERRVPHCARTRPWEQGTRARRQQRAQGDTRRNGGEGTHGKGAQRAAEGHQEARCARQRANDEREDGRPRGAAGRHLGHI